MRVASFAVAAALIAGCGRPEPERKATPAPPTQPPTAAVAADTCLLPAPAADVDWVQREAAALAGLGGRARRDSTGLHLSVSNGEEVVLRDQTDDSESGDDYVRHFLAAWRPELNAYEVAVGYYEGGATLLVDGRTGHRTKIWASPLVSPDRGRLVAASKDLEAAFDPNGLQIWRTDGDTLSLEWQQELEWGPAEPRWVDSTTLAVRAHPPVGAQDSTVRCMLVRRRGGEWQVGPR
jgi:hypothetical protein